MSASWRTEMAKKIFSRLPDSLLVGAGRMLYRHIG
jgi:hypothetical protein